MEACNDEHGSRDKQSASRSSGNEDMYGFSLFPSVSSVFFSCFLLLCLLEDWGAVQHAFNMLPTPQPWQLVNIVPIPEPQSIYTTWRPYPCPQGQAFYDGPEKLLVHSNLTLQICFYNSYSIIIINILRFICIFKNIIKICRVIGLHIGKGPSQ